MVFFVVGVMVAVAFFGTLIYRDIQKPDPPRFHQTDDVPGYTCVYDTWEREIVPNTCKEKQPG